ncbi:MAG: mechanosensitive ion channel [Desulfovibrio sp.]|jgi:small-conductance mechanosensitive channel|nr:mechanosensitive ion channel [Desulfovibrio sp.]
MTPLQNDALAPLGALAATMLCGLLAHVLAHPLALRAVRRVAGPGSFPELALSRLGSPGGCAATLLLMQIVRAAWPLPEALRPLADKVFALAWTGVLAWLVISFIGVLGLWMQRSYDLGAQDNLHARRMLTKAKLFQRLLNVLVALLALASALMVFEATRGIGASLLASAGIAGAVAGFSAQRLLGAIIAGVQIAVTQPIRLDDVVVVEGEWGRIEEIDITFVVVRLWDERRLVLPTTYFLERPIQNWTRSSAEILGTAFLHVDHRADVGRIRAELERFCREEAGDLWDGRVCVLQVTGCTPETLELRALVSAADAAACWDLRCQVREALAAFLRDELPEALPRLRVAQARGESQREVGDAPARP